MNDDQSRSGGRGWCPIILDSIADAVVSADVEGRVTFMNPAAEAITGWSHQEAGGRFLRDILRVLDEANGRPIDLADVEAIGGGESIDLPGSILLVGKGGRTVPIEGRVAPLGDPDGAIAGRVIVFRDLSERRHAEEASRTREELEARVAGRTAELARANRLLQVEVAERRRAEGAMRQASRALEDLVRASPLAIVTLDAKGWVATWNPAAERMFGWTESEVLGRPLPTIPDDLSGRDRSGCRAPRWGESSTGYETRRRRKDGTLVDVSLWTSPLHDVTGAIIASMGILADISDRKRAERERERLLVQLDSERARLRAILEQMPSGVLIVEARTGRLLLYNEEARRLFGHAFTEGASPEDDTRWRSGAIHPDGRPFRPEEFPTTRALDAGEVVRQEEILYRRDDGTMTHFAVNAAPLRDHEGRTIAAVCVYHDVTAQRRAERERVELLGRLVSAQEDERRRVSRELHDELGQELTALGLGLKALEESGSADGPDGRRLRQLLRIADRIGHQVHDMAVELRPTALDDLGLQATILNYAGQWSDRAGIPVDFQETGLAARRLAPALETTIYRVVQEALTNVRKHARARQVSLILKRRGRHILAIIEDDGRGFDAEAALGAPGTGARLGLLGMRERVALVGGTLQVESSLGVGTTVLARIPIPAGEEGDGRG